MDGCKHPEFAAECDRIHTFRRFPKSLTHLILDMSKSGFFYTGRSDCTVCFMCGGGVKDWEKTDIPWEEHAKFYKDCRLVKDYQRRSEIKRQRLQEREHKPIGDPTLCYLCQQRKSNVCLLPCDHICVCDTCDSANLTEECPNCYEDVMDRCIVHLRPEENQIPNF